MKTACLIRGFIFLVWLFFGANPELLSQDFYESSIRAEDGLKTDIVKCIAQDDKGFIWIGTDDGLIKYNGYTFTPYPKATPSVFIKDFLKLPDGSLYVISDLGFTKIENHLDSVVFKTVLEGARIKEEGKLWYPKSLYYDSYDNFWIAEPQSICKWDGGPIERFDFGPEDNSNSFVRSFNITQISQDSLIISSYTGNFYAYLYDENVIRPLKSNIYLGEINHILSFQDLLLVASSKGVYSGKVKGTQIHFEQVYPANMASYLYKMNDSTLVTASFNEGIRYLYYQNGKFRSKRFLDSFVVLNQITNSSDGTLWFSTEKGIVILLPQLFESIALPISYPYIEGLVQDTRGEYLYVLIKEDLYRYHISSGKVEMIDQVKGGYFLSGISIEDAVYISNGSEIWKYVGDQKVRTYNFSDYGRYIFNIAADPSGNIWFTQEAHVAVKRLDPETGKIKVYDNQYGLDTEPSILKWTEKGLLIGTQSPENYLYLKPEDSDNIVNLSLPSQNIFQSNLRLDELTARNDTIFLATNNGLFIQYQDSMAQLQYNEEYDNLIVKTIQLRGDELWFGNPMGLYRYNLKSNDYAFYNDVSGLSSNSVNQEGLIFIDDEIFVGTTSGLSKSHSATREVEKSLTPIITEIFINGKMRSMKDLNKMDMPNNAFMEFSFSALSYPANVNFYSYRIPEISEKWSTPSKENEVSFSELDEGEYHFEVKAQKIGSHFWSEPYRISFTIAPPFYSTLPFFFAVALAVIILILVTRLISIYIHQKRQAVLQKLVDQRTSELQEANYALSVRNKELDQFVYSASHDLSAPLKSVQGLINVMEMETSQKGDNLLEMMRGSIFKLEKFIKEIVDYSRNTRIEVELVEIKPTDFISEILNALSFHKNYSNMQFKINFDKSMRIKTDVVRFKIILNNLLSNAIKFADPDKENSYLTIYLDIKPDFYHFTFEDNGIGIPSDARDKIFDMFYRANTVADGSGLGLYITKECVEKLKGKIEVESKEGMFTKFDVFLPNKS